MRKSSIFSHPKTTALLSLLESWKRSPFYRGVLGEWVEVNPATKIPVTNKESCVSFLPMEAVNDSDGGFELQERTFGAVATGYTRFAEGDLICAKITPCMQNGKATVVQGLISGVGFGSTEFHVLRPKGEEVLPKFLFFVLTSRSYLEFAPAAFTGTAGQQRLPDTFLQNLPLPLPPLKVQREMVGEMEQARRRKLEQAGALLSSLDTFLLDKLGLTAPDESPHTFFALPRRAITGERLDPHFYNPAFRKLLEGLTAKAHKPLGDLVRFSSEQVEPASLGKETFRYIEISGVDRVTGEVAASELPTSDAPSRARMKVQQGDIIVSLTRPHHGSITLLGEEHDGCVASTGFAIIRKIVEPDLSPWFLLAMIRCRIGLQQMLQRSSGGNYPAITEQELKKIVIPLNSKKIQQEIVAELMRRRTEARRLREEAAREWDAAKARFEARLLGK